MLPQDVKTLAHYMEEAGYETAYIGKWHLASDDRLSIDHTTTAIRPHIVALHRLLAGQRRAGFTSTAMTAMCLMKQCGAWILPATARTV